MTMRRNDKAPRAAGPNTARSPRVAPAETPGLRALLTLQVGVVVVAALYFGAEICIPVTLAVLLSFLLEPLNALLRRSHLGRWPSASFAVLTALALIAGLLWLIGWQVMGLAHQLAADQATIARKLDALRQLGSGRGVAAFDRLREQVATLLAAKSDSAATAPPDLAMKPTPVQLVPVSPSAMAVAETLLARLAHPLATALVVFVVTIFIILQREDLRDRMIRLFGARDLHRTTLALDDAGSRLSRYFLTQLAINAGFGCLIAGGLFLIGVPSPVLWGILAMLLRFVPYFGTLLAAIPPLLLATASFPGWTGTVEVLALFLLVEPMVAQFVEPLLIGHSTGLSPISIVLAATFWTWLWGPIGLILSTPLTLCVVVLGRHVERLEFLDVLLGDQPALSPVESFYQRMLADDPDETLEQAEVLLQEMPLSTYYDQVMLPALQLASQDVARGVLDDDHLARMKAGIGELVDELDRHPDTEDAPPATPPEWPVLCVPGSGPLDALGTRIMLQILTKHGIDARLSANDTPQGLEDWPEASRPRLVCICALDIESRLSHLRYTARRVRKWAPGLPIAVAFWPAGGTEDKQRRTRLAVGASVYAGSLQEMVAACLAPLPTRLPPSAMVAAPS